MKTYEIPRNYKGESRILMVFSMKGLAFTAAFAGIGMIFYFILKTIGLGTIGMIIVGIFGIVGFIIGTLKIPDTRKFEFTRKTGGSSIDDVIKRYIKFKKNKNTVYIQKESIKK